jgi:hypothetical protein
MLFSTDRVFNTTTANALRENHQEPDQKLIDYFLHENGIEGSKAILSLPSEKQRSRNTKELVDGAWAAVEIWSES